MRGCSIGLLYQEFILVENPRLFKTHNLLKAGQTTSDASSDITWRQFNMTMNKIQGG